jgi:amino acid efflux transporter
LNNNLQIKPSLKLPQVTALYIGAVLGSGTLILPGVAAEVAGPASLLAWGLMIILALPMALTIGLLSARYPNAGGVAHFVTRAYNSYFGSLIGWYFLM